MRLPAVWHENKTKSSNLSSYRHLCRVHEAQSKVVFLYDVQMVHDLVKQLLTFGFFLIRETQKNKQMEDLIVTILLGNRVIKNYKAVI